MFGGYMLRVASAAALAAVLVAGSASAATVTVNSTIDLWKASIGNSMFVGGFFGETQASPPVPPFSVSEGDTLVWNADFAGNTQLTVTNMTFLAALFAKTDASPYSNATLTGRIDLLSSTGQVAFTIAKTYEDCGICTAFGQFDFPNAQPIPSVTFAGLRYTGAISDYSTPGVTTMTFNGPSFGVMAQGPITMSTFTVNDPAGPGPVPEPAAWALMIGGFGAAGAMLRRRRPAAV